MIDKSARVKGCAFVFKTKFAPRSQLHLSVTDCVDLKGRKWGGGKVMLNN